MEFTAMGAEDCSIPWRCKVGYTGLSGRANSQHFYLMTKRMMAFLMCFGLWMMLAAHGQAGNVKNCHPSCNCEVENFGLFDSFSLTRVQCRGVGHSTNPIPIPLDTAHLDLSSNSLSVLTDVMLSGPGYTTLVSLDLSNNFISRVSPKALSRLRYLETLDLSHNSLESLAEGCFSGLPLTEVDLSHNLFREFDLDVFITKGHGEPITVDLSHNRLTVVSRSSSRSPLLHVQSLTLAANQLRAVPKLTGIPLRDLSLDGNLISRIDEGAFEDLKGLVHLSLSGLPELSDIQPNSFRGLQSLQVLDLSDNNKLRTLSPVVFSGLVSLQELNLSNSGVTSLPNNMLSHLPNIKSITLDKNIHCWRTRKQGQFHRQLEPEHIHDMVLTCDVS
ncbi:tsukushin [Esox lucius]|uniref:LRRNT domain-containing protein n=2 Tax=Esox lucius TaxID=8010 RepID=A0A6Q2XL28_ESOLU|nr:tsukushin [Esox lucius]